MRGEAGEGGRSKGKIKKKEEFSGLMDNMRPENSFPQICVVSVKHYVENGRAHQDYLGIVA
jgi:hypothetical protein